MPWFKITEPDIEPRKVFVLSEADLRVQLTAGQTAEETTGPFEEPPAADPPANTETP